MAVAYDCEPTLSDTQVLEFCKKGFLVLKGVVPEETNKKTVEFLKENQSLEPNGLLDETWFVDNVIKNPAAAGAVRSLLGRDFGLPNLVSNHRIVCPQPAQEWHVDSGSKFGPPLDYLQVFYYPQDCPKEAGPTEVLPGSHHFYTLQTHMGHYGRILGAKRLIAPAGTIFITVYSIWHRRSDSTAAGVRNNLKYNYWRTVQPERDWINEPGFDLATANYSLNLPIYASDTPSSRVRQGASGLLCWLWGQSEQFGLSGGQGWPKGRKNYLGRPYGIPAGLSGE